MRNIFNTAFPHLRYSSASLVAVYPAVFVFVPYALVCFFSVSSSNCLIMTYSCGCSSCNHLSVIASISFRYGFIEDMPYFQFLISGTFVSKLYKSLARSFWNSWSTCFWDTDPAQVRINWLICCIVWSSSSRSFTAADFAYRIDLIPHVPFASPAYFPSFTSSRSPAGSTIAICTWMLSVL